MKKYLALSIFIIIIVVTFCLDVSNFGKTIKGLGGNYYVASFNKIDLKKMIEYKTTGDDLAQLKMFDENRFFMFHPEKSYFVTGVTLDGFVKVRYKGETDEFYTGRNAVGF